MRIKSFATLLVLSFALGGTAAAAAPDSAAGCAACHGEGGVSQRSDIPTIAGLSEFYLEGQMQAYQKGDRPCEKVKGDDGQTADMCDIAKALTADQIAEIDAYFSSQDFVAADQTADAALAAKGKALHERRCEICHSDGGSFADDDAGLLAGQWKPYLQSMLVEYRSGKRVEPEKMKPQTSALSDDDIKALVEFYASETTE
ncbi:c-type cytochrome [Algiphilus sp. W345]|uniref:C-type cytochrome n=1 Tax=Banduia mediterranea TaxID=3075609 RepID=A0ABU2WIZ1_9GAMM|nr:c-type cytochrome [Algiphilus sp. W345]MDT0497838.1 c-type cytochrome [Algiphilus sp. W345]